MAQNSNKPAQRLSQIATHLTPVAPDHATRFRPALPAGLPIHWTPLSPISFLLKAAQIRPLHVALTHPRRGVEWTYQDWAIRVKNLSYALKARRLQPGDRCLVLGPNVPFVADALQAIPAAQGIIVAINTRLSPGEVAYLLENSGAKLVLVDKELVRLLPPEEQRKGVQVVVCSDTGGEEDEYERFLTEGQRYDRELGGKGWAGLEFEKDENATFAISYTSGTTSRPKGVLTSYRSTYLAAMANAVESRLSDNSRYLWTLPMFHCVGWCFPYACTMSMATQVCLRAIDYSEIWQGLLERGVTHYSAAPTVQISIVAHPMARKPPQPVRTTIAGAAPTATLIQSLEEMGIDVVHVWGMTETLGPSTKTYYVDRSSPNYFRDMARQGHSFLTADDIRVVKLPAEGEEVEPDSELVEVANDGKEVGEIVCRGNIVMKGYWQNPKATAEAFAGGFMHTGDLAVRYPDGTFAILDRGKDIIISGGENVSSLAVESTLSSHEDVHEVAVVARGHEKWGERPHAFIVLKPSAASKWADRHHHFEAELKSFARGKMSAFSIPEWIEVIHPHELPKTSTGKVQKKELRDRVQKLSKA
ncbi:hypothetical protein JCM1841_002476 [Sporobolomyces salmonicolor]